MALTGKYAQQAYSWLFFGRYRIAMEYDYYHFAGFQKTNYPIAAIT
jgi:hypothetical protein